MYAANAATLNPIAMTIQYQVASSIRASSSSRPATLGKTR